jgi:alkaline phosphatase
MAVTPASLLARFSATALALVLAPATLLPLAAAQPGGSGITADGRWYDLPGCVPNNVSAGAIFCIFPTTMAQFVVGQRFEIGVEVHVDDAARATSPYPSSPAVQLLYYPADAPGAPVDLLASGLFSIGGAPVKAEAEGFPKEGVFTIFDTTGGAARPAARRAFRHKWTRLRMPVAGPLSVALVVDGVERARVQWRSASASARTARNVILFVGDGMASAVVSAARLVSRGIDQVNGNLKGRLNMQGMARLGFMSTSGYDSLITDSANSAAAYASGHKGCVNSLSVYCDCDSQPFAPAAYAPAVGGAASPFDDPRVELITEMLARKYGAGFGLGVVTTAELQDATPAAFFAHSRSRGEKADITRQLLEGFEPAGTPPAARLSPAPRFSVALGGGSQYFSPRRTYFDAASNTTVSNGFSSLGGRDFVAEFSAAGFGVAFSRADLALAAARPGPLLGLFNFGNNNVWVDRRQRPQNIAAAADPRFYDSPDFAARQRPPLDQPDLAEMFSAALARLAPSPAGFFMLCEGASVDKMLHPQDMERALAEVVDMDNAVGLALAFARARGDTLVLVTADHGHGVDVYGTVDEQLFNALDGATRDPAAKQAFRSQQAVLEYDGAGWPSYVDADGDGFPENWGSAATNRFGLAFGFADVTDQKDDGQAKDRVRAPDIGHAAPGAGIFGPDDAAPGGNNHGFSVPRNIPTTGSPVAFAGMREASSAGVHTLQDVPLWAEGPGSDALRVSMENVDLFRVVAGALGAGE